MKRLGLALWLMVAVFFSSGQSVWAHDPTRTASVAAQRTNVRVSNIDAITAIRRYVAGRLSANEAEIRIRPVGSLPTGINVIDVKESAQGMVLGRVTFALTAQRADNMVSPHWATVDVEWIRPVWVARRALKRLAVLDSDDVELRTISLSQTDRGYPNQTESIVGKRLLRPVAAGTPLLLDLLADAPTIARGASVTLLVEANGVRVTTAGQAKEEGFTGNSISVMNLDSRKVVYGEVVDGTTVKIPLH